MSQYPQQLIYYMWKWQVHFMISCKVTAESLFSEIDSRLMATSFLIGFKTDSNIKTPDICFEPEKMDFLANDFLAINQIAEEYADTDPRRDMVYSGDRMQEVMDARRKGKNFGEAIKKILDESNNFKEKIHFVAQGVQRDGYEVYIILQLNKPVYLSYIFLNYVDPEEIIEHDLSLIDATIKVYLEDYRYRLYLPEAGYDHGPERNSEEMLRAAAQRFLFTIALVGRSGGFYAIHRACNNLCLARYEGKENVGHLIICKKNHPALDLTLELDTPFPIKEYRKLRKLLELSDTATGVITNSDQVLGLGRITKEYDAQKEDVFHIYFRGTNCYDVMHKLQPILLMRYGKPVQQSQSVIYEKFVIDTQRIFEKIENDQIRYLYLLACTAAESNRGCMLVFIKDAENEAKRLIKQCITIKPKKLDKASVTVMTSIDGAVLVDLNGFAYAKGVILDGVVGIEGDSSRGSRYNSALTYCEYRGWQKPTMIVVVSEDGMVDIIPNLMPQIRHSEIIQFINTLESINNSEAFNDQTFYNIMDMLTSRSFYLTQMECKHVNELKRSLEELDLKSGKTMWRKFDDFVPNARMNERFYLPE